MSTGGLPHVGEILRDKYELVRTLGEGGMAVVFEGRHVHSGQRVAIKVLVPELCRDAEIVARFDREARAVGRLRTRHVAHVIEVAKTEGGLPFIVMDFLDGRDLASELEARKALPIEEAVDYILQTCAAMDEAHRSGVVHRDLKPANLFLTVESDQRIVKVLDFGISKLVGESSKLTGAGAVMGTVVYMSPEQVRSSTDVDQRADVWSLGVILFELLAGRAPFEGPGHRIAVAIVSQDAPDIRTIAPQANVPDELAKTIARMLAREREARWGSIHEAALALVPFASPNSVGARIVPTLGRDLPPRGRAATAGKTMPLQKRTVPMGFRPGNQGLVAPPGAAAAMASMADAPVSMAPAPRRASAATVKIEGRTRSGAALATLGGAVLGLVAAALVVYVAFRIMQGPAPRTESSPSPPAITSASASPSSSPSTSVPASLSSSSTHDAPSSEPAPPPTFAPATSAKKPDGPASVRPPSPAPATSTSNPTHL